MSLWEFACCMEGLAEFHGAKPPPRDDAWSEDEMRDLGIEGL